MQLDTTGLHILQVLQEDGHVSNRDLVECITLSSSAYLRHMRMLEEGGVITGYQAQLGRAALGLELETIVWVSMHQDVTGWHKTFMAVVQSRPEIMVVYVIAGGCNYILHMQVPNLQHCSKFIAGQLYKTPDMMNIHSSIVLRIIKDHDSGLALLMETRGVRPLEGKATGEGGRAK